MHEISIQPLLLDEEVYHEQVVSVHLIENDVPYDMYHMLPCKFQNSLACVMGRVANYSSLIHKYIREKFNVYLIFRLGLFFDKALEKVRAVHNCTRTPESFAH